MKASDGLSSSGSAVAQVPGQDPCSATGVAGGLLGAVARAFRYRFFVIAGVLPYVLGLAAAGDATGQVNWPVGILGLAAVIMVGLGIEGMNEYFDAKIGGDRAFASVRRGGFWWHLPLGLGGFAAAAAVGVYLTVILGWGVLAFAACGGAVALSYLMPPVRLSHRGLGETAIAVGYGPGLVLGGYYIQAGGLSWQVGLLSLVPGLVMFAMSLANEVPDYYGDRLVGKKNLVVRLGRRNGVILFGVVMGLWFGLIALGLALGVFPLALGLCLLLIPVVFRSVRYALKNFESPALYVRVVRTMILVFVIANTVAITSYIFRRGI